MTDTYNREISMPLRILTVSYATTDDLAEYLQGQGYTGSINDMMAAYALAQDASNTSLADVIGQGLYPSVDSDTTAPVIDLFSVGSPTGTDYPTTLNFTEANTPVTVYLVIDLTSAGAPDADQIKLGHGADDLAAAFSTNYSRSADGIEVVDFGTLADGAYTVYTVITDPSGNTSTVSSDTFTVASSVAPVVTQIGTTTVTSSTTAVAHSESVALGTAEDNQKLVAVATWGSNDDNAVLTATWDGNAMTTEVEQGAPTRQKVSIMSYDVPAGGTATFSMVPDLGNWRNFAVSYFKVYGDFTISTAVDTGTGAGVIAFTQNVVDGDELLAGVMHANDNSSTFTIAGMTSVNESQGYTNRRQVHLSESIGADETPRTMTAEISAATAGDISGAAIKFTPA
jgi:hypothetical protein